MLTIERLRELAHSEALARAFDFEPDELRSALPDLLALAREALALRAAESAHSEFDQKIRKLCKARHPYLNKRFGGPGMTERDEAELAEIERQIDEMQMAEIGNLKSAMEMKLDAVESTVAYKVGKLKLENVELTEKLATLRAWVDRYKVRDFEKDNLFMGYDDLVGLGELVCGLVGYYEAKEL